MRVFSLLALIAVAATPAAAQRLSNESTPSPDAMLSQLGAGSSDAELARIAAEAAAHPLGTLANPVRVGGPEGERAYLERLRCSDGSVPAIGTAANGDVGAYGTIVSKVPVDCKAAAPGKVDIIFDRYHDGHVEQAAPADLSLGR
jgi:hypothetical protein